jgi:formamidopyrimidine-DNA glycosylase
MRRCAAPGPAGDSTVARVPELPEVEALAAYLRERAVGHTIARVEVAAISALKTYDPPVTAAT